MDLKITFLTGKSILLTVNPSTTVKELKQKIAQQTEHKAEHLKLAVVNGQMLELVMDHWSLTQYKVQSGNTVTVLIRESIQVFLKNDKGKLNPYEIKHDETVKEFKQKVHHKEGIPPNQQRLFYEDQLLEDSRKMEEYRIKVHATIILRLQLVGG
ncbi:polyubiquitin-like [Polypterus senegalus]